MFILALQQVSAFLVPYSVRHNQQEPKLATLSRNSWYSYLYDKLKFQYFSKLFREDDFLIDWHQIEGWDIMISKIYILTLERRS